MKKLVILMIMVFSTMGAIAQKDVTKFLGIPVDGTKQEMISKLKAKGFRYEAEYDCLKGEFNGSKVNIYVITNNNKVCRIMVADDNTMGETDIRIRFNYLCMQFNKNEKYVATNMTGNYFIPEDEDISYQLNVNNKRYEASYYQLPLSEANEIGNEEWLDTMFNKFVWFMICEYYGKYYIVMYYDNEYNKADGEDL